MHAIATLRTTLLGVATWLAPFLVSILFFDRSGQLAIPTALFKSIMVVVFGGVGAALLVVAFRKVEPRPGAGLLLGGYWLALNIALDLLILLPMTGMGLLAWGYDIGLRYLLIPIMAVAMATVASRRGDEQP